MESKELTVAIPCYNAGQWLESAIQSALAQEAPGGMEVRVGDDGSGDNSPAVAGSFNGQVIYERWENRGGGYSRNRLFEAAMGTWVQFLDADDYLQPEKVRRQLQEAGQEQADVLYSPVWEQRWRDGKPSPLRQMPLDAGRDIFCQWFSWELPQTGGALWRRESLQAIGGWDESMPCCQEHELYLRAIQGGLRFRFTPTPGAVYRIWSEETVCRRDPVKVILVRDQLFDRMISWMRKANLWREEHRCVAGRTCFEMARTWAKYDLDAASAYFNRRKDEGLIHMEGPAAPPRYRYLVKLLGFNRTERLARQLRPASGETGGATLPGQATAGARGQ